VSMTLNERMTLYPGRSLRSVLETTDNTEALRLLEARLDATPWAVYRVRRILWSKRVVHRKTECISQGSRKQIAEELIQRGALASGPFLRLTVRPRSAVYPCLEEQLVAVPAVVDEKCRPGFEENWQRLAGATLFTSEKEAAANMRHGDQFEHKAE
jgi:hypothetical protein